MRQPLRALALLALLTLAACGSPATATPTPTVAAAGAAAASPATSLPPTGATPTTPTAIPIPTSTPVARASASPSPTSRQCAYRMTGYSRNQEVTAKLQAALIAGNYPNATAEVSDAGETYACNDNTSGFGLMNRDLAITLPVADVADRQALGTHLAQVLTVASQFATAPSQNRYFVTFTAGSSKQKVETTKAAWEQARKQGLTGAALLDDLQNGSR